jgi:glycosyltransferase involved in cell wall biosynthesis
MQPATDFGGAERQATYLMAGLPRRGIEVIPLVGPGRAILGELERLGVQAIHHEGFPADEKAPRSRLQRAALIGTYVRSFFHMSRELDRIVRRHRPDLVFASRPFSWVVGGRVGSALDLPVVWRAGTLFTHFVQRPWLRLSTRLWSPRAVVCTSAAVRAALQRHMPGAPMFVVHNGVDTARFSPTVDGAAARAALGLAAGPVVAFAGRLSPEKGLELLLEVAQVLRSLVPGVQVLVAGDSRWRTHFDAACHAAGLDETIRRLAFVPAVEQVYAAADVVLSTSQSEGCPNALLEAMAMGRPIVATAVGGTTELVRDSVDGVLVAPRRPAEFAARVATLLGATSRARELGRAALERVRHEFSLEVQLTRLAEILHRAARR